MLRALVQTPADTIHNSCGHLKPFLPSPPHPPSPHAATQWIGIDVFDAAVVVAPFCARSDRTYVRCCANLPVQGGDVGC